MIISLSKGGGETLPPHRNIYPTTTTAKATSKENTATTQSYTGTG